MSGVGGCRRPRVRDAVRLTVLLETPSPDAAALAAALSALTRLGLGLVRVRVRDRARDRATARVTARVTARARVGSSRRSAIT